VRRKSRPEIEDLRIGKLMEQYGFRPESSTSTSRALILNLVRSAYGADAAREFMRQMNLDINRQVDAHTMLDQFEKSKPEIPGVGTEEVQLSLFDVAPHSGDETVGTFHQKKSRRA
jgi:hypothetical protein